MLEGRLHRAAHRLRERREGHAFDNAEDTKTNQQLFHDRISPETRAKGNPVDEINCVYLGAAGATAFKGVPLTELKNRKNSESGFSTKRVSLFFRLVS